MVVYFMYVVMLVALGCASVIMLSRNVIRGAFCLAIVCACLSILMICFGSIFLGMVLMVVYIGAVAIIFLIAVMMLSSHEKATPATGREVIINLAIYALIVITMTVSYKGGWTLFSGIPVDEVLKGKQVFSGLALYQQYSGNLQLVAVILLASILGSVHITFLHKSTLPKNRKIGVVEAMSDKAYNNVRLVHGRTPNR